jgi:glycosyltransferase involved in cell wall biosynthesis
MPISIAEAMATGAAVVARDGAGARSYLGDAGLFFKEDREASNIIRELVGSPEKVAAAAARSIERARAHASAAVLPEILGAWRSISGK